MIFDLDGNLGEVILLFYLHCSHIQALPAHQPADITDNVDPVLKKRINIQSHISTCCQKICKIVSPHAYGINQTGILASRFEEKRTAFSGQSGAFEYLSRVKQTDKV